MHASDHGASEADATFIYLCNYVVCNNLVAYEMWLGDGEDTEEGEIARF